MLCNVLCINFCAFAYVTNYAVPSVPQDVRVISGIVVWGLPAEPNGVITGYLVKFCGSTGGRYHCFDVFKAPFETYDITSSRRDISTFDIGTTVNSLNNGHFGTWPFVRY